MMRQRENFDKPDHAFVRHLLLKPNHSKLRMSLRKNDRK